MNEPIVEYKNRFEAGNHFQDRIRNIPLKILRVVVNASGLVFEGECLYPGTYDIPIYADRVPMAMALVEPWPEKVAEAKQLFAADEAKSAATKSKGLYQNWVHAYRMLCGGEEPKPFDSCVIVGEGPPPKSDDEHKAAATTQAIVESILRTHAAVPAADKSKK